MAKNHTMEHFGANVLAYGIAAIVIWYVWKIYGATLQAGIKKLTDGLGNATGATANPATTNTTALPSGDGTTGLTILTPAANASAAEKAAIAQINAQSVALGQETYIWGKTYDQLGHGVPVRILTLAGVGAA